MENDLMQRSIPPLLKQKETPSWQKLPILRLRELQPSAESAIRLSDSADAKQVLEIIKVPPCSHLASSIFLDLITH
jgi:hypothetical protein